MLVPEPPSVEEEGLGADSDCASGAECDPNSASRAWIRFVGWAAPLFGAAPTERIPP